MRKPFEDFTPIEIVFLKLCWLAWLRTGGDCPEEVLDVLFSRVD